MQRMNVHEYTQEESNSWKTRLQNAYMNKRVRYATIACTVVLVFVITLSASLGGKRGESSSKSTGPRMPKPEVKAKVQLTNKEELGTFLAALYNQQSISMQSLQTEGTPQALALRWLTGREEYTTYTSHKRTQRFSLATFYYATFARAHEFKPDQVDWINQLGWLTDDDECTWAGIVCDTTGYVVGIKLPSNQLSGSLPIELGFLPHIGELDFTTNFIFMADESHQLWKYMINLQVLLLEDNFIVSDNGLPETFASLTKITKMQLSYNLLQGELSEEVFANMQSLQHLEIESNYLSGDIPAVLGTLPNLVYVYARRNLMSISLDGMLVADTYPSLFSLWLDNNEVGGTIPTTIGLFTGLASLSITNATLSGPIPTQIGLLSNLKRVWLYDNNLNGLLPTQMGALAQLEVLEIHNNALTGTMPPSICTSVTSSEYALRALTADCDSIKCDCCTRCYPEGR
jgi:Leucine rich repeat